MGHFLSRAIPAHPKTSPELRASQERDNILAVAAMSPGIRNPRSGAPLASKTIRAWRAVAFNAEAYDVRGQGSVADGPLSAQHQPEILSHDDWVRSWPIRRLHGADQRSPEAAVSKQERESSLLQPLFRTPSVYLDVANLRRLGRIVIKKNTTAWHHVRRPTLGFRTTHSGGKTK
jgi:hypothetical protein